MKTRSEAAAIALDVRDLRMTYGTREVLAGVTFSAKRGEVLALLGPNGAGKTTTIEILEGFRLRSAGEVSVLGSDPARASESWRARIGVVLQSWRDHKFWRVRELLAYLARFYVPFSTPEVSRPWNVDELLDIVGLSASANAKIVTLSGGQRRRLDVAIGIVGRPEIVFFDEPTAGFDPHALALDTRRAAIMAGLARGWIETRHSFTEAVNIVGYVLPAVAYPFVLYMVRGQTVPGTDFPLATMLLPSLLGMSIAFGGLSGPASAITADREDGTLLRAKAVPHGMLGYLVGKIVMFTLTTLLGLVVVLAPGILFVDNLVLDARAWLLFTLIFVVGMVSTVPIGVALGAFMKSSMQAMLVPLVVTLISLASGIFYPITALPAWLQSVAQVFPVYWVGLGTRSAMLPAEMVAAEIGASWRTIEMFAVLGVWAAIGLVLAPILLRRMARHQSGSAVAKVYERYMTKGY